MSERPLLPFYRPSLGEEEIAAVVETLRSGWLTMGPRTQEFEREFARRVGAPAAVAVNSCTAALHLALVAADIGPGDEVLVPTITFAATAGAVVQAGAHPVLVDCERDTLNLDPADAERRCTARTRAIIPVHMAGHPCAMDAIAELARTRGLIVIEDAAHALPAFWNKQPVGSISPFTAFSFYATKNLTTGEGGMLACRDAAVAGRVRELRLHGLSRDAWRRYAPGGSWRYDVIRPGFKYNMTDVAAAIGLVQLRRLGELQERRFSLVERYRHALSSVEEVELPVERKGVRSAWHLFVVRLRLEMLAIGRDEIIAKLQEAGIGTSVHFVPLHEFHYYGKVLGHRPGDFPVASEVGPRLLSLPLFPAMTDGDVDRVAATLGEILRANRR